MDIFTVHFRIPLHYWHSYQHFNSCAQHISRPHILEKESDPILYRGANVHRPDLRLLPDISFLVSKTQLYDIVQYVVALGGHGKYFKKSKMQISHNSSKPEITINIFSFRTMYS